MIKRSEKRPALTAEIVPTSTPNPNQMIPAPIESENVAGSPCLIWLTTFVWSEYETSFAVNSCFTSDHHWMKKPVKPCLSRPSLWRMSRMFACVATFPAIRSAGSPPGMTMKMR